jgi:putative photosynthetic complex assembly protein 2
VAAYALPALYALFVWWFSTGVILYLDGLPRTTFRWTFGGATIVLAAAFWGLQASSRDASATGAYCAFTCAVLIWAWQEVAFLLGYVTGPRRARLPAGAWGWRRALYALQTVLHHELALLLLAAGVCFTSALAPNPTGWWTFLALWAMRQSTKLNVFLGVRNWSESFLPAHLRYLESYFLRRPMNVLFPFSIAAATTASVLVWLQAAHADSDAQRASMALIGALLVLGVIEHWFLVLPLQTDALWRWGLSSHRQCAAAPLDGDKHLPPTALTK